MNIAKLIGKIAFNNYFPLARSPRPRLYDPALLADVTRTAKKFTEMPGDGWNVQACSMLGKPLVKIRCDGCMGEVETIEREGVCTNIDRVLDGAAPADRVIWVASGKTIDDKPFSSIVARCTWNTDLKRWEDRY